jgi:56kDa selenium binding protein (SBP56)
MTLTFDPTFYRSPADAISAPPERAAGCASTSGSSRTAPSSGGLRVHQVRRQGGDASSDSYCYRS